jgi:antitoxin VapB
MNAITTRTFKSGNSEAVRLPKGIGFGPGAQVSIVRDGDRVVVTLLEGDAAQAEKRARFQAMIADMAAMGPVPGGRQHREAIEAPERPGL